MRTLPPIAVDAMGGDDAPFVVVQGAYQAHIEGWPVVLVGDQQQIEAALPRGAKVTIVHAPDTVDMADRAAAGVRRKPKSSVRVAFKLAAAGEASGVVTMGNTGAAVVSAKLDVGLFDDVSRPAVATVLPRSDGGRLILLDSGANVDGRPELLSTFAHLGAAYATALGIADPRIGLLCNGHENTKGNLQTRATLPLLQQMPNFIGNIEPNVAMSGGCDVLVCDGFVGNILLKAAEGAVDTVVALLTEEIKRKVSSRLGAALLKGAFSRFKRRIAWDAHGGALLLGVKTVVVVGHGKATVGAVKAAVRMAHEGVENGLITAIEDELGPPV